MINLYVGAGVSLDEMRAHATKISTGDYRTKPQPVILHKHSSLEKCTNARHDGEHEYYAEADS